MQVPQRMLNKCHAKRRTIMLKTRLSVVRTTTSIRATQTRWTKWFWNRRCITCSTSQVVPCRPPISKTSSNSSNIRATATSRNSNSHSTTLANCTNWSEWCESRTILPPALKASLRREAATLTRCSKCRTSRNNSKYRTVRSKFSATTEKAIKCTSPLARMMWPFCSTRAAATLWVGLDREARLGAKIRLSQADRWCLFERFNLIYPQSKIVPGVLSFLFCFFDIFSLPSAAIWRVFTYR